MAHRPYPFLDIVALDAVRAQFADARAMAVVTGAIDTILWANDGGARLLGFSDIASATDSVVSLGFVAKRQIQALHGFPDAVDDLALSLRLLPHDRVPTEIKVCSILLPDGEAGLLLSAGNSGDYTKAIAGIDGDGQHAALIDGSGLVLAADDGFAGLALDADALSHAQQSLRASGKTSFKGRLRAQDRMPPCGIVQLRDDLYLVLAIDDPAQVEMATAEPAEDQASNASPAPVRDPVATIENNDAEPSLFGDEAPLPAHPQLDAAPATVRREETVSATAVATDEPESWTNERPIRFVWRTDASGRVSFVSEDFIHAVGQRPDDIVGIGFTDLAKRLNLDENGDIASLLERRDTWSGRVVNWPIGDSDWFVPVELAALPTYDRDRTFEGFRGFGIARMNEAFRADGPIVKIEPQPTPVAETEPASAEPEPVEPVETAEPVAFTPASNPEPEKPAARGQLNTTERAAFREIAERLRPLAQRQPTLPVPELPFAAPAVTPDDSAQGIQDTPDTSDAVALTAWEQPVESENDAVATAPSSEPFVGADQDGATLDTSRANDDSIAASTEDEAPRLQEPLVAEDVQAQEFARYEQEAEAESLPPQDTTLLDTLPVAVLVHAGDLLHYANEAFFALTGYADLGDFSAAGGIDELFGEPYAPETNESEAGSPELRRTMRLFDAEGSEKPVKAYLQSISWQGAKALLMAIVEDDAARALDANTELEAQIVELTERLEEMRTIVDTATDGVILIDDDETIRSISKPAEALFGFDTHHVTGKPFSALFAIESQRPAQDYLRSLAKDGVASLMNDGREVIGREAQGRFVPLFMTIGRLPNATGFCAVVRDITSWKKAEADLRSARTQAEEASSQKTDFLARVSHEIRTPLNAIIGFSELMMDEKLGPLVNERYRDYLRDINRSGTHVLDLVNDLLDISKIEAGAQEMSYEAVSLTETLSETVALMQPQANRERVIIRSSYASTVPDVVADLRSVRQIALNLLSNAIRYTQPGGQVIISTSYEASGEVIVRVRDTGIGMTQAEIEHALKPFTQINTLKRTRGDGTGLGLPLTKAMVEANRARFAISSTPGSGTMVEITFPQTRVLAE